jgi:beta-phosphoglucomutase
MIFMSGVRISPKPQAFLFDLNGTMIDDMHFHLKVWHQVLNEDLQANLSLEEVRGHMYGKNHELLDRVFGKGHFTLEQADKISRMKEVRYQEAYRPHLQLLPGLAGFLKKAYDAGIAMGIGSAAIPFNIDFVLDNLGIRYFFKTIVSADDVGHSKPHPETYLKAASQLNVSASECVVFEDAPKGVEAAYRAGMACVVVTTMHAPDEFSTDQNILMFVSDYEDQRLEGVLGIGGLPKVSEK